MVISENDLYQALNNWGTALVSISNAYETGGIIAATPLASQVIDETYGFDLGPVLFKPTMSSGKQTFRPTRKGALSYFIGNDDEFPGDKGFALKGWRHATFKTSSFLIEIEVAMWMGSMVLTDSDGMKVHLDKSFAYKRVESGALKIVLHHSSLPYQP